MTNYRMYLIRKILYIMKWLAKITFNKLSLHKTPYTRPILKLSENDQIYVWGRVANPCHITKDPDPSVI